MAVVTTMTTEFKNAEQWKDSLPGEASRDNDYDYYNDYPTAEK